MSEFVSRNELKIIVRKLSNVNDKLRKKEILLNFKNINND